MPKLLSVRLPKLPLKWSVNHGKIFVLFYRDRVRVVVSTANVIEVDFRRKTQVRQSAVLNRSDLTVTQGVWMQDFPRKSSSSSSCSSSASSTARRSARVDFEVTLEDYLIRLGEKESAQMLSQFDFSAARVVLISSVPGYHKPDAFHRYGHRKLRHILSACEFPPSAAHSSIVCQCSSIGVLSQTWLNNFAASCLSSAGARRLSGMACVSCVSLDP